MSDTSSGRKSARHEIAVGREPNLVDAHIGKRLRQRRMMVGLSQEALAAEVGCAFQQIQKYECAINRISTARLWTLAATLQCPVSFFYEGMNGGAVAADLDAVSTRNETLKLVRAYTTIKDPATRRHIFELATALAKPHEGQRSLGADLVGP